jgi:hypothetical protein
LRSIPVAFFASCRLCFDDYSEFIEGFLGILFFESWVSARRWGIRTFGIVISIFNIDVGFFFLLVFVNEVIID